MINTKLYSSKNTKPYLLISLSLIIISIIISNSLKTTFEHLNSIKTTGSAKKDFTSDLIIWDGYYSTKNMELEDAYKKLDADRDHIIEYLNNHDVPIQDAVFSSINIEKLYKTKTDRDGIRTREFDGYLLTQDYKIESHAVEEIEHLSRDITSLIDKGIEIKSNSPYYFYSNLSDLKIDMIAEATKNAKIRAERIAENSNSNLGKLINAQMGVFQITAKHSTERYTWGGTHNKTSRDKTAHVTMKLTYDVQ